MVAEARLDTEGKARLEELLVAGEVRTVDFDETQASLAHEAWREFGRGNGPARLSFGDCLSYALAKQTNRKLLFKGEDLKRTGLATI